MELMSSLTSLAIIRCTSKPLFGPTGLFAALKALPHLEELEFEPATGMLWAVYDNTGSTEFAGNPFGTDGVLNLPPEIPRPVPDDCSSIWCAASPPIEARPSSHSARRRQRVHAWRLDSLTAAPLTPPGRTTAARTPAALMCVRVTPHCVACGIDWWGTPPGERRPPPGVLACVL